MDKKKILIIEDEPDVAFVLAKRLRLDGFEVQVASDATMGTMETHHFKPDLIILDLMLPAGGGISVLKNIKRSLHTNFIPVLVLTGVDDDTLKDSVIKIGVEAYVQKPYDYAESIKMIKKHLGIV